MTFGEKLKKIRKDKKRSGEDIVFGMRKKNVIISVATYYNWENDIGSPNINQLEALALGLGIKVEKLI